MIGNWTHYPQHQSDSCYHSSFTKYGHLKTSAFFSPYLEISQKLSVPVEYAFNMMN